MLLHNNSYVASRNKDKVIHELLSNASQAVLFLNSNLEIIRINEVANKKFALASLTERNFLAFSQQYALRNSLQFAVDVIEPVKKMLRDKLATSTAQVGTAMIWHVEYFPELFETDFKLALLDITEQQNTPSDQNHLSQSVVQTVTTIMENSNEQTFHVVLNNIIQSLPGRAHIKSTGDFAYRMTNAATLKLLGMQQPQELVGLDDFLVSKHMGKKWPARLAGDLQQLDHSIIQSNEALVGKEETPYLDAQGNLVVHSLTKIPIYNLHNAPFGVLTLAMDMAHLKDIMFIKNAYFNLYDKPRDAHYNFIKHLGLDKIHSDINDLITIRELECLIFFAKGMTAKEIGRHLNISHRTVERHFESVKAKFNCFSRSDAIALFLTNFSFYTPGVGGYA